MKGPYDDMLDLPRPVSRTRRPMPLSDRAAQFSPFAALTGYHAAIQETGRLTESARELDESQKEILNRQLQLLSSLLPQRPLVQVTFFQPDPRKPGGSYQTRTGPVKKIDLRAATLILEDLVPIPLPAILRLDSPLFDPAGPEG